jgi:hypothetical protein
MTSSKYSLKLLDHMCIHSHIYLNKAVDTYYQYADNHHFTKNDIKLLKNISQPYFGIVFQAYNASKKDTVKQYGRRGTISIVVDKNVGEDLYNKCIEKNYKVIKYKISAHIEKETNIETEFIPIQWKKDENNQKVVVGRVWNEEIPDPTLLMINETFTNFYMLKDDDMYTDSHLLYYMEIVDYEETSLNFLKRFYELLIEHYGKPNIKNFDNMKLSNHYGMCYLASHDEVYGEEEDCGYCPNCRNANRDTDSENEDADDECDDDCDTDVE